MKKAGHRLQTIDIHSDHHVIKGKWAEYDMKEVNVPASTKKVSVREIVSFRVSRSLEGAFQNILSPRLRVRNGEYGGHHLL